MIWDTWKKGFDAWENATAQYLEQWMKSPTVLEPTGAMLGTLMKAKAASNDATARWWSLWGLPTRRDQERALHALNQLQSRVINLEERLEDAAHQNTR